MLVFEPVIGSWVGKGEEKSTSDFPGKKEMKSQRDRMFIQGPKWEAPRKN